MVTLLASVVNFVVDYLFIDILSAPTADSLKANRPNSSNNPTPTPNTNVEQTATSAESSSPSKRPHSLEIAKRASFKDSLLSNAHTRIVSTSLADAHSNAMETFKDAMGEAQSEVERVCQKITSQRVTRLTRIKSNSNTSSGGGRALPMPLHPSYKPFQHDGADVEDLFTALKEEIVEERALIRREYEKAAFEALWGSVSFFSHVTLLSLSDLFGVRIDSNGDFLTCTSPQTKLCGERVENIGEVIKKEIQCVQEETKFRVNKLRLATDIHIGSDLRLPSFLPSLSSLTPTIGMEILHLFILDLLGRYHLSHLVSCLVSLT